jgi:PAS domain S-box-containing protein
VNERLLVVDDDPALLRALPEALGLRLAEVAVETANSGSAALELIRHREYDAVVSDIKMPGISGLDLLREIRRLSPETPTLLITGHGEHDLAVQALRYGAYDFIQKPIDREYFVAAVQRALDLRRANREVERQRFELERHARVLERLDEGVFLVADDGTIALWNAAAAAMTGLGPAAVLGRRPDEVLAGWEDLAARIPVEDVSGGSSRAATTVPVEISGLELWVLLAAVRVEDGVIYTLRDVTHERSLDQLKTDFLATISHELRTPLGSIYGAAETLRLRRLDQPLQEELLAIISQECMRLTDIVSEILSASQLDRDAVDLDVGEFDASDVVRAVVETVRLGRQDAARIRFSPAAAPMLVRADRDKLHQVLVNLVDNALKYSPPGAPVELRVEPHERHVLFTISDQGQGIPQREQSRIFDKFYRLDPEHQNGVGGTGLGLYISRELVHRMAGRISVTSHPGRGSVFVVELPLVHVPAEQSELAGAVD